MGHSESTDLGAVAWSLVLLVAMTAHTIFKARAGTLPELLWGCNIASFMIIVGIWIKSPTMVGTAFLWHLCVGDPAFVAGAFARGQSLWVVMVHGWTSILVHTLPAIAAFCYLRSRGLPRSSPFLALLLFIALVPISHYLTPPALNINMAHVRWEPLRAHFPGNWSYRFAFCSCMLSLFLLGDQLFKFILGRPDSTRDPDETLRPRQAGFWTFSRSPLIH